ncbi:MAG TPA: ComF family protein [Acetobacteraceae bacterium]|nr:ComF family protein [Acetobacteraceae bacterium]
MRSGFERAARHAGRLALDLLLPAHCLTCDQPVDAPGQFCPACFGKTHLITAPCCVRCGVPFEAADQGGVSGECIECRTDPPPWGMARAALRYDDQARRILLPFKYGDRVETARALAPLMARAGAALLREADWLVPVPLHRRRLISRRYNQAALLARALARIAGRKALLDGLQRVRSTRPLAVMSPTRRTAELEGAIRVRPAREAALRDARVLLIDDVLTSGATARACVRALLAAGAAQVDVLAAARVKSQQWDR